MNPPLSPQPSPSSPRPRVIHFVTGGGSGATKVALDLACGHLRSGNYEPLLVLRRKKAPLPAAMQAQIAATGLATAWVKGGWKYQTLRQLAAVIADFRPDVFVAHGNSEHLWGRQAALAAHVGVVIHVEHNTERYPFWRRWSARKLTARTHATVCVSEGVAEHVRRLRLGSRRVEVIANSVDVSRFAQHAPAFSTRRPDIVMAARFARQKDHATLLRAVALLVQRGWTGQLLLAGGGKASHRAAAERLAQSLGLAERVQFLGLVADMPALYHRAQAAVLATHYEGFGLALVEGMAAGCGGIGSAVSGVTDIVRPQVNGWLVPPRDPEALAAALAELFAGGPAVEQKLACAREDVVARFAPAVQLARYETLFAELLARPAS